MRLLSATFRPQLLLGLAVPLLAAADDARITVPFNRPWSAGVSPEQFFRVNGPWIGTLGNMIDPALATPPDQSRGVDAQVLALSVAAAKPGDTPYHGSEIQSLPGSVWAGKNTVGLGFGYYEATMKITPVAGVAASFFWIEAPKYGPHEIDYEFLTNEPWIADPTKGVVHLTLHPSEKTYALSLPFNPTLGFHRYAFLWTSGQVIFAVDGTPVHTILDAEMVAPLRGFAMANTVTGKSDWGGGPPSEKATTLYSGFRFAPGLDKVPSW